MKLTCIMSALLPIILIVGVIDTSAQNLSALMDAISKMEKKLEKMVQQESSQRKAADARLKKSISANKGGGSSDTQQGTALVKAVDDLKTALSKTQANQIELTRQFAEITKQLEDLQGQGEDERVKEMAGELQKLIGELKAAITGKDGESGDKEEEEHEAMEIGGLVTVDFGADPYEMEGAAVEVGEVALSANVIISDNIVASITLLAEGNLSDISID